jgi:hypothetical protein
MNTTIIDKMLKMIECRADSVGYDIDSNADYVELCQLVTDITVNDKVPTIEEKQAVGLVLNLLFDALGLDYNKTVTYLIDEYYGRIYIVHLIRRITSK